MEKNSLQNGNVLKHTVRIGKAERTGPILSARAARVGQELRLWRPRSRFNFAQIRLELGLLRSCSDYRINIHPFTCPRGTLNKEQGPRMKNTNLHDPDIYYYSSFDILWLLYINVFQNIHSVNGLYTNLCLWFDKVRVKTNLKFCLLIHYFPQKGMDFYVVDYLLG